jgi:hypothetical protein
MLSNVVSDFLNQVTNIRLHAGGRDFDKCTRLALMSHRSAFIAAITKLVHPCPSHADRQDVEKTVNPCPFHAPPRHPSLTTLRSDLHRCTLSSLLALNPADLALGRARCGLGLLGLLDALRGRLLLLAGRDGGLARCFAGFRALRAALLDYVERGADNSALVLDCAAGALLGHFLYARVVLVNVFPLRDHDHDPRNCMMGCGPWEGFVPQRYPSCVVFGRGLSMRCGGGSCVEGKEIRSCRFGSGKSCYHRGRRACPVHEPVSERVLSNTPILIAMFQTGKVCQSSIRERERR